MSSKLQSRFVTALGLLLCQQFSPSEFAELYLQLLDSCVLLRVIIPACV